MITNPGALHLAVPVNRIDQIIGVHTGAFIISAPTAAPGGSPTNASDSFTTGFGDTCLFQGIFSVDGGASWNDFGSYKPNLTTPAQPVLQTVTCRGWVTPAGVFTAYAENNYDLVHGSGVSYVVQYKVAFLAKDDQGAITPLPRSEILNYSSSFNYQKIYIGSSFANGGGATTIAHNLGYVPKVRAWITSSRSSPFPANSLLSYDWPGGSNFNIKVNSTNAVFDSISGYGTANILYRIYLDS